MNDDQLTLLYEAELVRAWAFRLLLETHEPVELVRIAAMMRIPDESVETAITLLEQDGRLRRDSTGRVIGSAGLTISPTQHRIEIERDVWWTWCAYDAVGILAALGRGGLIKSVCAQSGVPLSVQFAESRPVPASATLFIADEVPGISLIDDWCPKNNFFCSLTAARDWSASSGVSGSIVSLQEGAERAVGRWRQCLALTTTNIKGQRHRERGTKNP